MLQRVWKKGNPLALLVGMEIGALTTENSMEFLKKLKIVSLLGIYAVLVQMLSRVRLCDPMGCSTQASLSITNSWSLLRLMSIDSVMPSNRLILCCPLLLLPSVFPSIGVFSNESALCISWPKDWSFSFSISPSNEYLGFLYFRIDLIGLIDLIDWFDLLTVQGTLKSLLQQYNSKASILWWSAFYGPTLTSIGDYGKNHSFG